MYRTVSICWGTHETSLISDSLWLLPFRSTWAPLSIIPKTVQISKPAACQISIRILQGIVCESQDPREQDWFQCQRISLENFLRRRAFVTKPWTILIEIVKIKASWYPKKETWWNWPPWMVGSAQMFTSSEWMFFSLCQLWPVPVPVLQNLPIRDWLKFAWPAADRVRRSNRRQ